MMRRAVGDCEDIVAICSRHLRDDEIERMVAWVARRVGRHAALAGDRSAPERLRHVVVHWLSEGQRSALAAWLARRAALGQGLVPDDGASAP
jgi:hypothetical protein